jgi:hypothetical protein
MQAHLHPRAVTEIRLDHLLEVAVHNDGFFNARALQTAQDAFEDRFARHGEQRFGTIGGQWHHSFPATGGKDHRAANGRTGRLGHRIYSGHCFI